MLAQTEISRRDPVLFSTVCWLRGRKDEHVQLASVRATHQFSFEAESPLRSQPPNPLIEYSLGAGWKNWRQHHHHWEPIRALFDDCAFALSREILPPFAFRLVLLAVLCNWDRIVSCGAPLLGLGYPLVRSEAIGPICHRLTDPFESRGQQAEYPWVQFFAIRRWR